MIGKCVPIFAKQSPRKNDTCISIASMKAAVENPHSLSTPYGRIDCGAIMNGKCLIRMERFSCRYQGRQELRNYRRFASLTVKSEDAKAYVHSLSGKRRVHKWTDIQANLYI